MRAVVLAGGLVWLAMLAFPVAYAVSGAAHGVELWGAVAALVLLVGIYVQAVVRTARTEAPRPAPLSLAIVAAVALALPLVAGPAWFGGTVLLAALLGLSLPARAALIAVVVGHRHRVLPSGPAMITVLVVEDHPLVRRGIVGFLSSQPDLAVVAEAGNGAEALRLAMEHRPDVAVVDLELPRLDGVETIRRLTRDCPHTRVMVLTSHEGDADIFPAISAGALSYLLKEATPEELAGAVRAARPGRRYCTPGWPPGWSRSCAAAGRRRPTRYAISPSGNWRCCGCSARACPTPRSPGAW